MEALLDDALERALNQHKGTPALTGASATDLSSYSRHWTKACARLDAASAPSSPASIPLSTATAYLSSEIAHAAAVQRVLAHLGATDAVTKEIFTAAAHLLYGAVHAAQESIFASEDLWGDARPASSGKQESSGAEDKQQEWVIGTVAAAQGISVADGGDGGEDGGAAPATPGLRSTAGSSASPSGGLGTDGASFSTSPGDSAGAVSIGSGGGGGGTAAGANNDTEADAESTEWAAFDVAFTEMSLNDGSATARADVRPPTWSRTSRPKLSLAGATARLATVPGTGLAPMTPDERRRCEEAFRAKGFEGAGGMRRQEAERFMQAAGLPAERHGDIWLACDTLGAGALDTRQFCLFMHLLQAAVGGAAVPAAVTPLQAAQLLGDVPLAHALSGNGPAETLRLDTARLRAVLAGEEGDTARGSGSTARRNLAQREQPEEVSVGSSRFRPEDFDSDYDSSDDEDAGVGGSSGRFSGIHIGGVGGSSGLGEFTLHSARGTSPGGTLRGSPGAVAPPDAIPRLQLPSAAAIDPAEPSARLFQAAWAAEAGTGHSWLEICLKAAALMQKKTLDRPFVSLSVRDPVGRLVELPQDSHPGRHRADVACIEFGGQALRLTTPLRSLPPGCLLFLEVKQWKPEKRRFSTVAWSFVDAEMMIDAGAVATRVRCGPMVLPLFKKPLDPSLQRLKRLNGKGPGLHIAVRGVE